jgi:hypothetical protein
MFYIVCVVVSMFTKSDFKGTYLVWALSELSEQGGGKLA